jgi:HEAT repeat protein/tRNA A-37 threonylcarbamoyl transferase component Bud32
MGKGGYFLSHYCSGDEIQTYEIVPGEEIQTIGSAESCHIRLYHDAYIQPIHAMLRFNDGRWQICPVVSCQIDTETVEADEWRDLSFMQYCYLSSTSALQLNKSKTHGKTEMTAINVANLGKSKKTEPAIVRANLLLGESELVPPTPLELGKDEEVVSRYAHFIKGKNAKPVAEEPKEELTIMDHEEIDQFLQEDEDDEEVASILAKIKKTPEQPSLDSNESKAQDEIIPTEMLGKTIANRYHIIKKLGAGAMGEVYEANDNQLRRRVALKILSTVMQDSVVSQRFANEIKAVGKLQHPHIVAIHDVGEYQNRPFFTMDLLVGDDLKKKIEQGEVAPRDAMEWIQQIALALQVVHQKKIIHRDIKPSNILITAHGAILTDFGIAKDTSVISHLTTAGETLGTPAYMPPEQARGISPRINATSDIYSLGAVLYELLTRCPPFSGSPVEVMQQVCTIDPPAIRKLNPDVHHDTTIITMKAMAKEQGYRYQSAQEMADDIRCYLDGQPLFGKIPPIWARAKYNRNLRRLSVSVLGVFLVVLCTLGWILFQYYKAAKQKEQLVQQYLSQAEGTLARAQQMPSEKIMDIVDMFTQTLILSPGNTRALKGKFEAICLMAGQAQKQGNLEFAEALYYVAVSLMEPREKETAEESNLVPPFGREDMARIRLGRQEISELKVKRKEQQRQEAEKVLDDLNEENVGKEVIEESALSLLRFPDVFDEICSKYQKNARFAEAIRLARKYVHKKLSYKTDISHADSREEMMIQLLPYSGPALHSALCKELESDVTSIRLFCSQLLGLTRCQDAIQHLLKRLRYDNEPGILRSSLRSLLMIEGGGEAFLEAIRIDYGQEVMRQVETRRRLIQQLSYGEQFALDLALKILDQYQSNLAASRGKECAAYFVQEEPCLLQEVFVKLKKSSVASLLAKVQKAAGIEKLLLVKTLAEYPDERVLPLLLQEAKNSDADIRLAAFAGLGRLVVKTDKQDASQMHTYQQEIMPVLVSGMLPQETVEIQTSIVKTLGKLKWKTATGQIFDCLAQSFQRMETIAPTQQPVLMSNLQELQKETLSALRAMGEDIIPMLQQRLQHEKGPSKLILSQTLATLQPQEAIPGLVQYLASGKTEEVQMAIETLRSIGLPALPALQEAFHKGDNDVRYAILRIIEDVPQDEVFTIYEAILADSTSPFIQQVLNSLCKKGERGYQLLLRSLFTSEGTTLQTSAQSLAKIQPTVLPRLMDVFEKPQAMAEQFKKDQVAILDNIAKVFIAMGRPVLPQITPLLEHKDTNVKVQAVRIIGKLGDARETVLLLKLLFDATLKSEVKRAFINDMKSLAVPDLLSVWKERTLVTQEKQDILEVLGEIGDKRSLPIFYALLDDPALWKVAASALRKVGSIIIPDLIMLLQDDNKKRGAGLTLQYMGAEAIIPLLDLMSTTPPYLNSLPFDKLRAIRKEVPCLLATFEVRKKDITEAMLKLATTGGLEYELRNQVWEAIGKMGTDVVKHLVVYYETRESIADMHIPIKKLLLSTSAHQTEALPLLMSIWKKTGSSSHLVHEILLEIGRKDNSTIARYMISALRDKNPIIRRDAAYFLRDIKAKQAIPALQRAQTDTDPAVRGAAQNALQVLQN